MNKYLNITVIAISIATVLSGLTQIVAPGFVLGIIGAEITPTSSHFFAIVGMFMTLFGGLMLQTVYSAQNSTPAITWSALQKLGAAVAVGIGVMNEIFSPLALGVAGFDLLSGILFLYYLKVVRSAES